MLRRLLFPAATAIMLLTGCQTSNVRTFEKLHVGMDKHQVLEAFGTPNATTRMHGRDRWMYRFYDDGIRFDKEVHFVDGMAVYAGDVWAPPAEKTAVAVDEQSAEKEKVLQADIAAHEEARKKNAELYMEYEQSARNQDTKVKYLPQFKELE
jgi:outer membrane protein assembly factor BamE (lipoprotein component of BamABCDE complex)